MSNLGGGPGYLRATNGCWTRVSTTTAHVQSGPVAASVTIDGLTKSPIVAFTGSSFGAKARVMVTYDPNVTLAVVIAVYEGAKAKIGA